ncbi:MAG TPA: endonuclease/exonuclease/phosphatase family protein [Acidimicrobiales bacterium]|nr:endonuclease/exonuclease/phosphatase family protein [Acidimicrobiales bacterium]
MPAEVRVATLNLFNNPHGRWADREPLVHEQAAALDADVLAFQECDLSGDQIDRLASALGPSYSMVRLQNPDPSSIKSLVVVSRLPVKGDDACLDLGSNDIALRVRLEDDVEVITTHLHFGPSRRGSEIRAGQVRKLLAWIGPVVGDRRVVLCGDFNAGPRGETIKSIKQAMRSAYEVVHGDEPESTHPTELVRIIDPQAAFGVPVLPEGKGHAIDYVFVAPAIEVRDCRIAFDRPHPDEPGLFPSDHVGLVADLVVS